MTEATKTTLSVGNYSIESETTGFVIYAETERGAKEWVAKTLDPETAMRIVEGLILVEMKRFYYPESDPTFKDQVGNPLPPFLKKGSEAS
jgi:hypothetical protein